VNKPSRRLCLIPARGGSKRLPRKNIAPFLDKPMLVWSIECAQDSGLFETLYVSTEDREIGALAEASGAVWDPRPERLACDRTSVAEVCLDFLAREVAAGRRYDVLTVLYAASPLRKPQDIVQTVSLVESGQADFAMTVTDFSHDPCEALVVDDDGAAQPWHQDLLALPRKARPNLKIDVGSTYAVRVQAFEEHRSFYGPRLKVVPVPAERGTDIDTVDDLVRAEFYARRLGGAG
jgi:pseudaminic acid cytidylyltransferase